MADSPVSHPSGRPTTSPKSKIFRTGVTTAVPCAAAEAIGTAVTAPAAITAEPKIRTKLTRLIDDEANILETPRSQRVLAYLVTY
jgi:hypothetical protein